MSDPLTYAYNNTHISAATVKRKLCAADQTMSLINNTYWLHSNSPTAPIVQIRYCNIQTDQADTLAAMLLFRGDTGTCHNRNRTGITNNGSVFSSIPAHLDSRIVSQHAQYWIYYYTA